jgi:hypothetical protein
VGEAGTAVPDNHSAHVRFDESVLPDGALLHARLAIEAVRRDGGMSAVR